MALYLFPLGMTQFFDDSGAPLNGGKLYTYQAGTTTALATYQDIAGATPHANPIVLDADGRPPAPIWLKADTRYKFLLQTSLAVELDQWDDVFGVPEASTTSEWVAGATPTYVSASTFTQQGDTTSIMQVGRRLRLTDASTLYGTISVASYAAGTNKTTVTVVVDAAGVLSSSLSAVDYGLLAATNKSVPAPHLKGTLLSDAAHTIYFPGTYYITPTAARILTLDSGLPITEPVRIINLATAFKVTINASAGATKAAFQDGAMTLYAKQATPTTPAHWGILEAIGGASPKYSVTLSTGQVISSIDPSKINFDTETFDNNSNFDASSNYRFTPSVPGYYLFQIEVYITSYTDQDRAHIHLYKNGSPHETYAEGLGGGTFVGKGGMWVVYMNGTTDYVEAYVDPVAESAFSIASGGSKFTGVLHSQ